MTSLGPLDREGLDNLELNPGSDKPEPDKNFEIQIDRVTYRLTENRLTGTDLRRLPDPPIPPERDLFEIIPGHPDRKVENDDRILIADGLRFFTAPNTINPGAHPASRLRRIR
jgi:hypothetical protein